MTTQNKNKKEGKKKVKELNHPPQYDVWKTDKLTYGNGEFSAGIILRKAWTDDVIWLNMMGEQSDLTVDEAIAIISALSGAVWHYLLRHHVPYGNKRFTDLHGDFINKPKQK